MDHSSVNTPAGVYGSSPLRVEFKIVDERLRAWGFPRWGSQWAAGLDLHACIDAPIEVHPQQAPLLVSAGMSFRIGDPNWCALVLPRSGLGHKAGLVLGNMVGLVDPDFDGPCQISLWNRNPAGPLPDGSASVAILVSPGDRIAQLVFTRVTRPLMVEVASFTERSERGSSGYGSTGIRNAK
jgi:dUTP pyrophosphatase